MTTEQKRVKADYGLKHYPSMSCNRETAFNFAGRGEAVILGDNGMFWVMCYADASKCLRAGLEKAA